MSFIDPTTLAGLGVTDISQFIIDNPGVTVGVPAPPVASAVGGLSTNTASGKAILQSVLRAAGLADSAELENYISDLVTQGGTVSDWQARLNADLYDPTTVPGKVIDQKYPAIQKRIKAGDPISVGDYQGLKRSYTAELDKAGLTPYVDHANLIDNWIVGGTSVSEASDRIAAVQQEVYAEPPEARAEMARLFGADVSSIGAATAYFLGGDKAVPKIQQQIRAAGIAGSSARTGYGLLTADEATTLAQQGVTVDQAQQGFTQLGHQAEVFGTLPGEVGAPIGRSTQLAAEFGGNVEAQQEIERKRRARLAVFGAGGGWNGGQKSVSGLGSAAV